MKTRKVFSFVTAAVMSLASLPVLAVNAAEVRGDIDGDGYVTGHDTAVLSRALYTDGIKLEQEQVLAADLDDNGRVDQADLEILHQMEQVPIGGFNSTDFPSSNSSKHEKIAGHWVDVVPTMFSAYEALFLDCNRATGCEIRVCKDAEYMPPSDLSETAFFYKKDKTVYVKEVVYNVLDANGDGYVNTQDAFNLLMGSSRHSLSLIHI